MDVQLHIDGEWRPGAEDRRIQLINPATGEAAGSVAAATQADMDAALASTSQSFRTWSSMSPVERGQVLRRAAGLLRERIDEMAPVLTEQQGKTLFEAKYEINASAESFDWFAEEARRVYGRIVPARAANMHQLVFREPVGPVAGFVPWNFGMGQAARKVGAALAAGCSIILKGPEETPSCCAYLVEVLAHAGLPKGVVNLLFGVPSDISEYLIAHPVIRKISFTGSTAVGKELAALAGRHMKRITMELGGHAPVIVTADVDMDKVVPMLVGAKYRNAGQVCTAPTRFLIEEAAYGRFVEKFARGASDLKVSDGTEEGAQMGPLANARRIQAMETLIGDATDRGGRVVAGGQRLGNIGNFFQPTVMEDVPLDARAMNEEPFGPLALMRPFGGLDEAIAEANRLEYGLAAYAFTNSNAAAMRISREVESGMVSINGFGIAFPEVPFGGIKDSGYGSEGGTEAIEAYLSTKLVSHAAI
jgi:succinate-semialdehyde dehydrogenase / glutarate-semialdehyde dehydrogenase